MCDDKTAADRRDRSVNKNNGKWSVQNVNTISTAVSNPGRHWTWPQSENAMATFPARTAPVSAWASSFVPSECPDTAFQMIQYSATALLSEGDSTKDIQQIFDDNIGHFNFQLSTCIERNVFRIAHSAHPVRGPIKALWQRSQLLWWKGCSWDCCSSEVGTI